ncbi:MAG: hypothetical protein P1T08_01355 [Acidimicrobiia bacterium]|nr:hypothetical protein [Acidimicrobiia bacterium]
MTRHSGTLQRPNFADTRILFQVSDGKCTIVGSPGKWIGSLRLDEASFERRSIREFGFLMQNEKWIFVSDDPASFADSVGVVIDLRSASRFGLGERVRRAREEQRLSG